jgi:hypothetical protein
MEPIVRELLEHRMTFLARGMEPPAQVVLPPEMYERCEAFWQERCGMVPTPLRLMGFEVRCRQPQE